MTRPRSRLGQAGFTMIEVMVAVLLTGIATSGIIGLYMVETRASGFSRHQTEATVLAQDQMERLRASNMTTSGTTTSLNEKGQVVAGGLYTRTWTIGSAITTYADVVVTVSWLEDGVSKAVTLRSRRNL